MDEFDWCASPPSPFSDLTDFDAPWPTRFCFAPAPNEDDDDQFDDFGLEFELDDEEDPSLIHSFVSAQSLPNGVQNSSINDDLYVPTNPGPYAARQGVPGQMVGPTYHHLSHHIAAESSGLDSPSAQKAPYFSLVISTPKKVHQRQAANMRERKRMKTINDAFECLRERIPVFGADKKLSKVDTLRLAVRYIQHLTDVLTSSDEMRSTGTMTSFEETESKVIIQCRSSLCAKLNLMREILWRHCNNAQGLPMAIIIKSKPLCKSIS